MTFFRKALVGVGLGALAVAPLAAHADTTTKQALAVPIVEAQTQARSN